MVPKGIVLNLRDWCELRAVGAEFMIRFLIILTMLLFSQNVATAQNIEVLDCQASLITNSELTESTYWDLTQFQCGQMRLNGATCLEASAWDGRIWQYRNMCRRSQTGVNWTNISLQIEWEFKLKIERGTWFVRTYMDENNHHCFRSIALLRNKRHFIEYCDLSRRSPFTELSIREAYAQLKL